MPSVIFPPIDEATEEGLVGVGGDLSVETLVTAYSQGIFPWPISAEYPLTWFSPDPRGVLFVDELHLSRSFKKFLKNNPFHVIFNQDFEEIISKCQSITRVHQVSTWITRPMLSAYSKLFSAGHAFCVGVYQEHELVGGLYGVKIGQYYAGESMFHLRDNASKFALYSLIQELKNAGIPWLDTQMVTEITEAMGAKEIERKDFIELLKLQVSKSEIKQSNFP